MPGEVHLVGAVAVALGPLAILVPLGDGLDGLARQRDLPLPLLSEVFGEPLHLLE